MYCIQILINKIKFHSNPPPLYIILGWSWKKKSVVTYKQFVLPPSCPTRQVSPMQKSKELDLLPDLSTWLMCNGFLPIPTHSSKMEIQTLPRRANPLCLPGSVYVTESIPEKRDGNRDPSPSVLSISSHARNIVHCCTKSIPENRSTGLSLPVVVWDNVYLQTLVPLYCCHCPYCSRAYCLRDIVHVFCLSPASFCLTLLTISFLSFVLRFPL